MSKARGKLRSADYVHLHNHTQFSLLDGLTKVPALVDHVKNLGMEAIAITDHGTMSGAIEFYKTAKSEGIKPIIGMEAYVAPRNHTDKDVNYDRQYYHLTILAMSNIGYQNLMRLSTIANLEGFYYKPRIDRDLLARYNEGLIILSGCIGGELSDALRQDQVELAENIAQWYKQVFGDRYYIELQDHGHPKHPTAWQEQTKVNEQLLKIAGKLDIQAVVTCDAHYLKLEDKEAHEILLCVQTGAFLKDEQRMSLKEFELHVADPKQIISRWGQEYPQLIENTKKIANRCEVDIELGKTVIPMYPTPQGESEKSLLHKLTWQGLAWRYGGQTRDAAQKLSSAKAKAFLAPDIQQRAIMELEVIDKVGYNGFFLIVNDFINWGKDQGIVFGPGRGSTAGSIVAYGLRFTELDPLKYDLLFERFLTPDRVSPPDMDIDIQDSRRDEVINYCIEKYGRDRVANIVTFGRMAARNSVRDVARVLQVPYSEADRWAKLIPPPVQGRHTPLFKHLKEVPELKQENADNPTAAEVFDLAVKLEGTIRSHGVHAAGVVIAPDEIVKYVPLEMAQKGVRATQYSMGPIEDLGLLKIDFLGLSNLTTIKNALRIIKKVYSKEIDIDTVPLDDKKTYALLQRGETTGVFQLESAGMKRYLRALKPNVFEDIIAMVALYRPGPMQWIDDFIARKHGQRKIEYMHPIMEASLQSTYGIIVYQEQVMQISKEMCGFTGSQADTLRKGIGKKIPEVLAKMKKQFIEGGVKTVDADRKLMEKFWNQLEDFAAYCFNKSHAACYALIAYQTAYLKANYPAAFMAALMTSDYDNTDRLAIEIAECKHMGIEVLPPDVNESFHEFAVVPETNQIRFGLDAVKNVGHGAVDEIIRGRERSGGRLETIEDYCRYVNPQFVNRKALECLIKSGALDRFGDRSKLLHNIEGIINLSSRFHKDAASGQVDLFGKEISDGGMSFSLSWDETGPAYPQSEQLIWERDLLGLYLSRHPLETYETMLQENTVAIAELLPENNGSKLSVGGVIVSSREITTRNGAKMAFVRLADMSAEIELVIFPTVFQKYPGAWERDKVIVASGKVDFGRNSGSGIENELKMIVDAVQLIKPEDAAAYQPTARKKRKKSQLASLSSGNLASSSAVPRLYIRLEDSSNQTRLITLREKLDIHHGETEVVLVSTSDGDKQVIKLPQTISINEQSLRDIASLFGTTNVIVR